MLVVVLLFMAATVAVPALQSLLVSSADDLPLGLSEVDGLVYAITLVAGLVLLFLILCLIYWTVPNRRLPWRAIWPGALGRHPRDRRRGLRVPGLPVLDQHDRAGSAPRSCSW